MANRVLQMILISQFILSCHVNQKENIEGTWKIVGIVPIEYTKIEGPELAAGIWLNIMSIDANIKFDSDYMYLSDSVRNKYDIKMNILTLIENNSGSEYKIDFKSDTLILTNTDFTMQLIKQ